ncbi:MAG: Z1 domain-containing protein [Candidatus Sulfotelmatobacter sp.]
MTNNTGTESVEVLRERDSGWYPVLGPEIMELLRSMDFEDESRERVQEETVSILAKCGSPKLATSSETGIVIGLIQSGKTMSFTAVTALARDNGFRLVIVITGTSVPLFNQSNGRIQSDLRLPTRPDRKWQHLFNPKVAEARTIRDTLLDWEDPNVPDAEKQAVLITVMKNHKHLRNLISVLRDLPLATVPALVIDDEADQAGMNTRVKEGGESTTYRQLSDLRRCLPRHSFLQYTATPQAPLLINLIDMFSPRFVKLITPGQDYVGGREFFFEHPNLVRTIPADEIPGRNDVLQNPPDSLLVALRIFFIGVAAGLLQHGGTGNRSMMIHPSQERARHAQYFHSVQQIREQWEQVLGLPPDDPDRLELLEEFRTAHGDVSRTVENLPSFEMISPALQRAVRKTQVTQLNSAPGKTPDVGWNQAYAHILVGGQAMDRGFTVKGLTVTYMPRGLGVGNADTVQQRARFFGYKRTYLGYCRIFLDATVRQAYQNYVDHDQDIRDQLARHNETGRPLSDWKRVFFLDSALRPTRSNVLFFDYTRGNYCDDWHEPKAPHDSEEVINANRAVVGKFIATLNFQPDEGSDKRTEMQRHLVATSVRLCDAYGQLLTRLRVTRPGESQRYTGLLLQIEAHLQTHPDATCSVYRMAGGRARERSVDERNEVKNLFQGANYDGHEETYPGDRKLHGDGEVVVQLHTLNILGSEGAPTDVPAVAVWVPHQLARDWISQVQA